MKRLCFPLLIAAGLSSLTLSAQQGIHGPRTVSAANTIVNEYTSLTATTFAGATSLPVTNSALNANGRFSGNLVAGDMIMIVQVQGVVMRNQNQVGATDTTWGRIDVPGDYYSCGRYEFHQVTSVPNATTINIDCALQYSYILGSGDRQAQIIRVPRFTTLTINSGGVLTCDDWNGTTGGMLVVEVSGNVVINTGGSIDATGKGFRGGSIINDNVTSFGVNNTYSTLNTMGAERGEGVAGDQVDYDTYHGGRYCRGAGTNGGGGGDAHNAGGGGGANAPNSTSASAYWSGNGIPDPNPAYTAAWNLEPPVNTMSLRTAVNSAGGGRGGYTFSDQNMNATTLGPGQAGWGGDARNHQSTGLGGRPLDYSNGRLFLGGGGGAGDQNQGYGGSGGDGGGLVYLMVYGNISGSGSVISNGAAGSNAQGVPAANSYSGRDGAGGGGAGGTIVLNAVGGVANTLTVNANGGLGGSQVMTPGALYIGAILEAEGPGGGGGGGYVAVSSGTPTRTATGGNNGTTNSGSLTEFPPNGATRGCPGTNNASITNFDINVTNISICTGNTVTLTASFTGTPPAGATLYWYTSATGGTPVGSGTTYTTPALFVTTTYYVGSCPGWWREPVVVTVGPQPVVTISPSSATICSGNSVSLTASGTITYNWMPGNLSGATVNVSPSTTTTYTVTGTTSPGCSNTATVQVTVNPTPTVTASASSSTICSGTTVTLTGGGATSYTWNPGNISGSPINVIPGSTTTYTVTGTSLGCSSTAQVTVTVNPSPTITATASSPTICSGNSTTLSVSGASTYVWNPGSLPGNSIVVSPSSTTTYTVTGTAANGCTSTAQVTVTVNTTPTVTASTSSSTICSGNSVTLTGSGASTYVWNPGNTAGNPIVVSPSSSTTYTVTGTAANGCTSTGQVAVTVNTTPTVTAAANNPTICSGNSVTLTGSGASTYVWNPGNTSGNPIVVSPSSTTTYTVTGTAGNGCTSTGQVTVTVNTTPTVTAAASAPTICNGSSTTLTGSGASTYSWLPGPLSGTSVSVSPSTTTTYTVTGTAANGCTSTAQVTVTVNSTPTVTATSSSPAICVGDSSTLSATGASSYSWNPGSLSGSSVIVNPASTTTYTVTGTDANGCTSTSQVTLTVNPLPVPVTNASPATICFGQSTSLTASGGTAYSWNGGPFSNTPGASQTDSPVSNIQYSVVVTDANGCSDTGFVSVVVNPLPVANAGADQTVCSGTAVSLNASGGTSYSWNGGPFSNTSGASQNDTPVSTTTYVVTVTDANSCSQNDTVVVNVNALPVVSAGNDLSFCANSIIQLNASGAATYVWTPAANLSDDSIANPVATPVATTTYVVVGTDANGCSSSDTITLTLSGNLTIFAGADVTICPGDTAVLSTSGGTIYSWLPAASLGTPSSASTTAYPSATTTYTVQVTDANNCQGTDTVTVFVNPALSLSAAGSTTICIGQSTSISASASGGTGSYTYNWSNSLTGPGPHTVSPVITTVYTVSVTDSLGCSAPAQSVTVTVNPPLSLTAGNGSTICSGDNASLTASGSGGDGTYTYTWLPGPLTGSNVNVTPSATTIYTVIITDGCGTPADSATVTITVNNRPSPSIQSITDESCPGSANGAATVSVTSGTSPYTYSWNPTSQTTATASGLSAGTYTVTITDANGCTVTQTATIATLGGVTANVSPDITIQEGDSTVLVATGGGTYLWSSGQTSASITVSPGQTTNYCVTVTDAFGCFDTACVDVTVESPCGDVFVPNAFSPDGSGKNDLECVYSDCIESMTFMIFDRWGEKVFESTDPAVCWDGTFRGQALNSGVYAYTLEALLKNGDLIAKKGTITLVR